MSEANTFKAMRLVWGEESVANGGQVSTVIHIFTPMDNNRLIIYIYIYG